MTFRYCGLGSKGLLRDFGDLAIGSEQVKTMTGHSRARSKQDGEVDQPSLLAREAVRLAPHYVREITGRRPVQMTGVAPADEGGWIVDVEVVEDQRIPSSA